jgi:hypothetical protein
MSMSSLCPVFVASSQSRSAASDAEAASDLQYVRGQCSGWVVEQRSAVQARVSTMLMAVSTPQELAAVRARYEPSSR